MFAKLTSKYHQINTTWKFSTNFVSVPPTTHVVLTFEVVMEPQANVPLLVGVTGLSLAQVLKQPNCPGGPWKLYGSPVGSLLQPLTISLHSHVNIILY